MVFVASKSADGEIARLLRQVLGASNQELYCGGSRPVELAAGQSPHRPTLTYL